MVVQGECEVRVDGGRILRLSAGELVLFPRGDAHDLCSADGSRQPAQSGVALALAAAPGQEVRGGGSGVETVLLCGAFFVTRHDHPALAAMPRVVHVSEGQGGQHWLAPYVNALESEVRHGGPGSAVVTARLSDALVARALRYEAEVADEPGLLHGLADPYVAPVLAAMHDDPARPWTVASLAAVAGLSRAAFADALSRASGHDARRVPAEPPDGSGQHVVARRTLNARNGRGPDRLWIRSCVLRRLQALCRNGTWRVPTGICCRRLNLPQLEKAVESRHDSYSL